MDFATYATRGLDLANLEPYDAPTDATLREFVAAAFPWWAADLIGEDFDRLRVLAARLRSALVADADEDAVAILNTLLAAHPVSPQISGHGGHDEGWHLHLDCDRDGVADRIASVTAMGLVVELLDTGVDRRGVCEHPTCEDVYLDGSPGATRRYCSEGCANRANVAAWRARRKAATESEAVRGA